MMTQGHGGSDVLSVRSTVWVLFTNTGLSLSDSALVPRLDYIIWVLRVPCTFLSEELFSI